MNTTFNDQIITANIFLQENDLEKAIIYYQEALAIAEFPQQKKDLYRVLGRLFQKSKQPEMAARMFEAFLAIQLQENGKENLTDLAAVYNNLGSIYENSELKKAVESYRKAHAIYKELLEKGDTNLLPHIVNTNLALGEAHNKKNDYYMAKKHLNEVLQICDQIPDQNYEAVKGNVFYNLGNIYTEEFNLHDAKINYQKALAIFEELAQENKAAFQPYVASVYNNLGITFKSMEDYKSGLEHFQKAMEHYLDLTDNMTSRFLPYLASTYSSMGILAAEFYHFDKALFYTQKAREIYAELTESKPQEYRHYLATSIHNLGLYHLELKETENAETHFLEALKMRKNLAYKEPENFNADVCATALNLVELYQFQLENTLNFIHKKTALDLLGDVTARLEKMNQELPVYKTMSSDCNYYTDYFNNLTHEQLLTQIAFKKTDALIKEINSTTLPSEKIPYQLEIIDQLERVQEQYPKNAKITNELGYAYNDLSWLYIRIGDFKKAEVIALKASHLELPILPLKCNLAHSYLLQNQFETSQKLYLEFLKEKPSSNESPEEIILNDFKILSQDGIYHQGFERIKTLIQY